VSKRTGPAGVGRTGLEGAGELELRESAGTWPLGDQADWSRVAGGLVQQVYSKLA
jgi:hypothetical protein